MKVSIIIPFRKLLPVTRACIASTKKQTHKDYEVITISDSEKKINLGTKHIFVNEKCGPGKKRNAGVKASKGNILLFLDSDCILKQNTLENIVKTFNHTNADAVSGKPLATENGNLLGYITGLEYENRYDTMGENWVSIAATTCFSVKRGVFNKLKGFEDYTNKEATGEDWDFSKKLTLKGFKLFHTNNVEVIHEHGSDTLIKYLYRQFSHARYRATHYRKHKQLFDEYYNESSFAKSILLNIPETIEILIKTKDLKILLLPGISLLRNISWVSGIIYGMIKG